MEYGIVLYVSSTQRFLKGLARALEDAPLRINKIDTTYRLSGLRAKVCRFRLSTRP